MHTRTHSNTRTREMVREKKSKIFTKRCVGTNNECPGWFKKLIKYKIEDNVIYRVMHCERIRFVQFCGLINGLDGW